MNLSRRSVLTALGSTMLTPLITTKVFAVEEGEADAAFAKVVQSWLDESMRLGPVTATQTGDHRFDALIDDVTPAGRAANLDFAKRILAAVDAVDRTKLSRANQVDAALLANAMRYQIWTIETLEDWAWNPLTYQSIAGGAVYNVMAREFAPVEQRLESATARMELLPVFLGQVRKELQLARVPAPHAATYSKQNIGLKSIVSEMIDPHKEKLSTEKRARLDAAIATYNKAVDEHQEWIDKTLVPAAQGEFRSGAERFDQKLAFVLQTDLTRAEIRRRAEAAVTDIREKMYAEARKALAGKSDAPPMPEKPTPQEQQAVIHAALELAAADRPARDKLVEAATNCVEEARTFVSSKDLITLPEGPVRVILMPEFQRGFAAAYCDSPGPLDKNLETFYAVSPIPDDWTDEQTTSFLREYNSRGLLDIGIHEAMPGHYVQLFHANSYPSVLRAILGSGTFVEGWAVYSESMMVENGFREGDPLYKLTQLKLLLRAVTNSIIDQAIHVDGMSEAEMMKFLTETAFQEEREAAGKWRRAQLSFTQLSTYFVGFLEHMETRSEAERRDGAAFNLKAYNDKVLSFGSPPMRYARALMFDEPIG